METDLSLIEISGEDDSLLSMQQISQNDNVSASNYNSYFSCSPLLRIPRSTRSALLSYSIESIKCEEDKSKPISSLCEDSADNNNANKENVNLNKSEMPKLSLEPQQMKRKKKGGGYNLRKSLAWDRAFFTEEGVLDPLELSMLSGNLGKTSGEMLSVIHEGRESLSGELDGAIDSPDLQALEDNLFKELPSSTPNGSRIRKIAGTVSPKLVSPASDKRGPVPTAKRKVLSVHDINRSASKRSGCPLPVASSSLKRSPNTNTTKVATKGSRVSKLLAPKQDPSFVSKPSRSSITSASHSKSNYVSRPVNAQKNTGLKGTSTNTKTARNDVKSGPAEKSIVKSTAQQAKRNVVKVSRVPEIHSSSNVQLPQVRPVNNSSEVVPDSLGPAAHPATVHDSNTSKILVSFSQNACYSGGIMQRTQPQTAKPSGLRMPSPSLGFFGQSKPSGSHSLSQRGTQSCNLPESNIPNFSRAGALNPIHQKLPRPSRNIPACSSKSYSVAQTVDAASCEKNKSDLELNNMQQVALQAKFNSESYGMMNHKQQLHNICDDANPQPLDLAEPCKIEKISCMEHVALQSNNSKLPLQSGPCEQLQKDDHRSSLDVGLRSTDSTGACLDYPHSTSPLSLPVEDDSPFETNNTIVNQHVEDTQYNPCIKDHNVCSESQSAVVNNNWNKTASKVHEDRLTRTNEAKTQGPQQAELMKPDTCKVDLISNVENQGLSGTLFEDSRSSEDLNIYDSSNAADSGLKAQECCATSYCPSHCIDVEPTKDGTTGIDYMSRGLHAGDTQMLSVVVKLLVESDKSLMSTSQLDNSNLMITDDLSAKSAEQAELPNSCLITEPVFQDNCGPLSNGSLLHGKESKNKDVLQSVKSIESRTDACGGEAGTSNLLCSVSSVNQDSDLDAAGKMGRLHVENVSIASADSEPVVENFRHDTELCNEANALALERIGKSHMIDVVITGGVNVNNFSPNSGDFSGKELENPHITSQISCVMQVKDSSGMNDISEQEGVIDKQFDSSVTNLMAFSGLQPGNDACYGERSISTQLNDFTSCMHDVKVQSAEQAKLINSCSHEAQFLNQSEEVCGERRSLEDVSAVGGSGSEIPHCPHQCEIIENEPVDNMMNEVFMEDAPVQFLHDSLLTDSCNSNVSASLADKSSLVVDDISTQPKDHPEFQNLDLVIEQVPQENLRLCSDDKLLMNTSIESQEKETLENVSDAISEEGNSFPSDSKRFDACIQISPPMCDVGLNVDKNAEHQSMEPSVENIEYYMDCKYRNDYELDNQACPLNCDSSSRTNGDQMPLAANSFDANNTSNGSIQQGEEVDLSESNSLSMEAEINIRQHNGGNDSELQDGLDSAVCSEVVEDATLSLKKSVNDKKQDAFVVRPPPNAVPFSEEWLAAFEAAGEEILAKKGGAVQNSPPDKSLPEPGPWSPVRRKNNQGIGPYDCTKFTNTNIPSSTSD